jgi:hypothetical protein
LFSCEDAKYIEKTNFAIVTTREIEALAMLEHSPWVELSAQQGDYLLGWHLTGNNGKLVLLRALGITERLEGFSITWFQSSVRVRHIDRVVGGLKPETRRAIVAYLPGLPHELYVEALRGE